MKVMDNSQLIGDAISQSDGDIACLAPRFDWSQPGESEHLVQFYETEEFLIAAVSNFIGSSLKAGGAGIVIANSAHRAGIEERLLAYGVDLTAAIASAQYIALDDAETLSRLMVDGRFEPSTFAGVIEPLIANASARWGRVRVFGEMVALLWAEGNYDAAIRLEQRWNALHATQPFLLFCGYPMQGFDGKAFAEPLGQVCGEHSRVIPTESYMDLNDSDAQLRAIALLQQQARALQAEIADRTQTEERLRASENRYRRLFETARDGILIVDPETHRVTDANPAMRELLGLSHEEFLGRELWELGVFADQESTREILRQLRDDGCIRFEGLSLRTRNGVQREAEFIGNLYQSNGHQFIQCNFRDLTERKSLEELRSHLAAIVESSDDVVISKSLEGIILSWNKGAERIFGYTAEEAIGQPIHILIPPDRIDEEPRIIERLRRGERIDHYETVRLAKDGRAINISLTVSPIRDASGKIVAASKIARDITEQKRTVARLEQALQQSQESRKQAEEASRLKDEFLANVSHELRTPLTAMIGWVRMLRSGKLSKADAQKGLETIDRNAKSQAQLIEDLLDISRIISGKMHLKFKPLTPSLVVSAAVDAIRPTAEAKEIGLRMIIDPNAGPVLGDHERLQQVVWNLVSNAIKFTPKAGHVEVKLERVGSNVEVTVSDSGKGMKPEFLPVAFDRFSQADGSSTRATGGMGLGLSIVKSIIELHGGSVWASSEGEGKGATFTVSLPIKESWKGMTETKPAHLESMRDSPLVSLPELAGLKILVVDDELDTCEMVNAAFEECGASVRIATSAAQALGQMDAWTPDVLVADINMPEMDGYELIRQVRTRAPHAGSKIPAIALTAMARIEDRTKVLAAGYQMHVAKPVELEELRAVVASLARVVIE